MNAVTQTAETRASTPYHVDTTKGSSDMNVSMQWMRRPADQKYPDLNALFDAKKKMWDESWWKRSNTRDFEIMAPEINAPEDMHKLSIIVPQVRFFGADTLRDVEVSPTHWAFGKLCSLARAPSGYLREKPSQLVADLLTHDLRFLRDREEIKLTGGEDQLYTAVGPEYGLIPDHEVVAALQQIAGDGLGNGPFHWKTPGKLDWATSMYHPERIGDKNDRTFYGSDRDVFVFLVDDRRPIQIGVTKDGKPDLIFRGFYIQNSMVGARSLKICAFYLRGTCENRILWGVENFEEIAIRHTQLAPDRWAQMAVPALQSFTEASDRRLIESVQKAKEAIVVKEAGKDNDNLIEFLRKRNFSRQAAAMIIETHEREEGKPMRSAWDFAQGITAYARSKANIDDRLDVELEAKRILDPVG